MLGCQGDVENAWQRPYIGEVAHYKVTWPPRESRSALLGWF